MNLKLRCCSCTSFEMLNTTWPSERYSTIGWVGSSNRCWMMFATVGTADTLAPLEVKKGLFTHWENDAGFSHRRLTNRANRALERSSKYTGDSMAFMKTKARLSKSLDRDVTLAETFKYVHTLKENKARFVDQQSKDHYESYTQRMEVVTQQSQQSGEDTADGSAALVVDPDAVWCQPASVPYKNCVYGMWSFFASILCTSTLRLSSGSAISRAVQSEEGVDLRVQTQLRAAGIDPTGGSTVADGSGPAAGGSGSAGGTQTSSPPPAPSTQDLETDDDDDYLDL
ncbi:hypothetical protein Ahy_A07g033678 [Arachis hypogaea]|uniref:Uncharacterized protein n=1 Tax=Arachis hypogaea TaxID=3818 RepID=A0A445C9U8_ARAHY|nr:hypothetical protein Ahy_A07g033678 [Arachis hypogaea]